jgi:hypothetical protein
MGASSYPAFIPALVSPPPHPLLSHCSVCDRRIKTHFSKSQFIVVSLKQGMFSNANVIFRTKFVEGVGSTVMRTIPEGVGAGVSSGGARRAGASAAARALEDAAVEPERAPVTAAGRKRPVAARPKALEREDDDEKGEDEDRTAAPLLARAASSNAVTASAAAGGKGRHVRAGAMAEASD